MEKYNHKEIEKKWSEKWEKDGIYKTGEDEARPKFYILDMFPYPSGAGLHVGHPKGYIATDIFARMKTMQGYNVLHPMGWDAFGLPAENFALKNKTHPREMNEKNIATFKSQLSKLGFSYDWDREINTTDPEFYKWTQWTFLQMFNKGLAFESNEPINWCPSCKTGLANEDLEDGKCERCDSEIERKPMRQWVLRITDYADRMLDDIEKLPDWDESIKEMQKNWIGRSEGAEVDFKIKNGFDHKKIYLATGNKQKIERAKKIFAKINPELIIEQVPDYVDVAEVGKDGLEISKKKLAPYENKYDYPVLAQDTCFFFDGQEFDPTKVKRIALGDAKEEDLSQEEIAEKMKDYYSNLAKESGDKKEFYFEDNWTMLMVDGSYKQTKYNREYILTDQMQGELDIFMPIRSLYIVKATGKSKYEQTEEEYFKEFAPQIDAFRELMGDSIKVFTTRIDTLFSGTFLILAPDHKLISKLQSKIENYNEVEEYVKKTKAKSDLERTDLNKDKTGVELKGIKVINPSTDEEMPVWISDFVLANYGTGAVFADAHDERDFEMAKKYNIPLKVSVRPKSDEEWEKVKNLEESFTDKGILVNSGEFDGLESEEAMPKIIEWLEKKGKAKRKINYKLRDWVFSRQRYWGEPIPIIHCEKCGPVGVPESELPVELPDVENYEPTGTGESPLANITEWVNTKCPKCGGEGKRETNTMPQWAGSSWYYLRYIDPKNETSLVDKDKEKYWSPVDFYVGGAEHATRHLIYARFWHKFLFDIGAVSHDEPFKRLQHVGLIMAEDGRKMSKRWGNVINPDEIVESHGADAMRVYEMFMGPFSQSCAWSTSGLKGARGFLEKIVDVSEKLLADKNEKIIPLIHKTIKKVGEDIEEFKFNTAISQMMILVNSMKDNGVDKENFEKFLIILAPFAPHLAEELWSQNHKTSIFKEEWPKYDENLIKDETIELAIQINGKLRDTLEVDADISENEAKEKAVTDKIKKWTEDKEIVKIIYVKGRLINIVVK